MTRKPRIPISDHLRSPRINWEPVGMALMLAVFWTWLGWHVWQWSGR